MSKQSQIQPVVTRVISQPGEPDPTQLAKRASWGGQAEFILTCIGYAVGLGNVWRFPYLTFRNGGGAFIIPYAISLLLLGMPIFFFELCLGQFGSLGQVAIWKINPLFKGIGFCMLACQWVVALYYNIIIAWCLYYLFASMTANLPWADCNNAWNTQACIIGRELRDLRGNETLLNMTISSRNLTSIADFKSPSHEFYYREVIKISDGIDQPGGIVWQLAICLLLSWTLIFLITINGIKSLGKSMYFVTIFPYVMLLIFLIRGATLPGSRKGVDFYMQPNLERLKDGTVWSDAATQIFYSLSTCTGGLISMSSFNNFRNNVLRDAILIPLVNCATSLFAGFSIFTVLGFMADQKGVSVADVAEGGPGLVFIVYPEGLTQMPAPTVWAVLFFLMMSTLGFSSMLSIAESVFVATMDNFPHIFLTSKKAPIIFRGVCCAAFFLLGLPMVTRGGFYLFDTVDLATSGFPLLIIGFFELISVFWIYGWRRFIEDILMMLGHKKLWDFGFYIVCWVGLSPVLLLVLVVVKGIQQGPFVVEGKVLPPSYQGLAWCVMAFCVIWIPVNMIYRAIKDRNCKFSATPEPDWGPALPENRTGRYAPKENDDPPPDYEAVIVQNKDFKPDNSRIDSTFENKAFEGETTHV